MNALPKNCTARSIGPANDLISTLLTTLIATHCSISTPDMYPENFGSELNMTKDSLGAYDFVVVGGGTTGSIVASRLAENPKNTVLLLEAGGNPPIESQIPGLQRASFLTKYDWAYATTSNSISCLGRVNESCIWHKGKMLGGSSALNEMIHLRGNARDYDEWVRAGNGESWGWRQVLTYFKKFEDFHGYTHFDDHGSDGPMRIERFQAPRTIPYSILKASRELGYRLVDDFVGGNDLGFGYVYGQLKDGRRLDTARAYLIPEKPNLHVIKRAWVRKIRFDEQNEVKSLSFVHKKKRITLEKPLKELILSVGAIETPKLLMISGVGPSAHLQALNIKVVSDLRVGDNLQDHVKVDLFMKFFYESKRSVEQQLMEDTFNQWAYSDGALASSVYDVTGFVRDNRRNPYPDIQYMFREVKNFTELTEKFSEPIFRSMASQLDPDERIMAISVIVLKPESRGMVRLASDDYRDRPIVIPNSFAANADLELMVRGIQDIMDIVKTKTFSKMKAKFLRIELPSCDNVRFKSSQYWSCYAKYMTDSLYDPVGTTKMGHDKDADAVVDSELRLRGVKGVRVIDASVMPTIPSANTNAASIMIAEKGADLVKLTWPQA